MAVVVSAVAGMVAVAVVVTTFAAATSAAVFAVHAVDEGFDFLGGGGAVGHDGAFEVQGLTGQRMVEVHHYYVVAHFLDNGVEVVAVGIGQRHYVAGIDAQLIKLSVDAEEVFLEFNDVLFHKFAVGFFYGNGEVEGVAVLESLYMLLKRFEGEAQTGDETEGIFFGGLFNQVHVAGLIGHEEFVVYFYVVVDGFHDNLLILLIRPAKLSKSTGICALCFEILCTFAPAFVLIHQFKILIYEENPLVIVLRSGAVFAGSVSGCCRASC